MKKAVCAVISGELYATEYAAGVYSAITSVFCDDTIGRPVRH